MAKRAFSGGNRKPGRRTTAPQDPCPVIGSRHADELMRARDSWAGFCFVALGAVNLLPASSPVAAQLQPFIDRHQIAGAVTLIGNKEDVVSVEMVGSADLASGRRMTPDTVFWIASMTKSVTGLAVMMLVDEGKISVDDPVEKYLPGFTGLMAVAERDDQHVLLRRPTHPLTIRALLTHTGGLEPQTPLEPRLDVLSLRQSVLLYPLQPLRFEPGARYLYSNAGTNTLGRIVEVVSGVSFDAFLQQRLFGPLGMTDTTFWPTAAQMKRLAKSYRLNPTMTALRKFRSSC